jgi:hypothetical protein
MREPHENVILVEEIYELVDERAEAIKKAVIEEIRQKQDEDLRYLNQRIDTLNQRIDTAIQMLMELSKQVSSQKNQ